MPATASAHDSSVQWGACPHYSARTFKFLVGPDRLKQFKALWHKTQCGELDVPLDYGASHSHHITIAFTRLRASDPAHRLGSLAVNPGGPGGSGFLMPLHMITARSNLGAKLHQRYDLIGFDPRGVGYSTKVNCPDPPPEPPRVGGPMTEQLARELYAIRVKANITCATTHPALLRQQTTANVARDLDRIRQGLGERRISFLGVSWGTLLGAVYRSLYPSHVQRMWLDSPAPPFVRADEYEQARAHAMATDVARFAAWLAKRNAFYHFGSTTEQALAALTQLREQLDSSPRVYTDLTQLPIDGSIVAQAAAGFTLSWPLAGPLLKALRDAPSDTKAPPEVQLAFGGPQDGPGGPGGQAGGGRPPADLPEDINPTQNIAGICNEDAGKHDFDSAWARWQDRLRRFPITGEAGYPIPECAGWTLPVHAIPLRRTHASLVMSVHRYELISPYGWGIQMQRKIGGRILTVGDDVHTSAAGIKTDCAPKLVTYFLTGRLSADNCAGVLVPRVIRARLPNTGEGRSSPTGR